MDRAQQGAYATTLSQIFSCPALPLSQSVHTIFNLLGQQNTITKMYYSAFQECATKKQICMGGHGVIGPNLST